MPCRKNKCDCFAFNEKFCKNYVASIKAEKAGQKELFLKLWRERPHVCFVTGDYLGEEAKADFFFHVLPKGGYPKYKVFDLNLVFTRSDYHHDWHSLGRSQLLEKDPRWQKVFDLYEALKMAYPLRDVQSLQHCFLHT